MTLTTTEAPSWLVGFRSLEVEHADPVALDVEGAWPAELEGTLYRMGPARFAVHGDPYRHWFDGDGMVHAVRATGGQVTYRNRFVATDKIRHEDAAGRRLGPGFGTPPAGGLLQRLRHLRPENAANTSVVWHAGRLHALWEQGHPWRLDPVTLETLGEDDLGGALGQGDTYSAHPRPDPTTGDLWNFGVRYGPTTTCTLFRTTPAGHTEVATRRRLPWASMVHEVAITERKIVVLVPPLSLRRIPLGLLLGRRSYEQSLRWRPGLGTAVLVYDIKGGTWTDHGRADPLLFFHVAGAADDGDDVVVDICASDDRSLLDDVSGHLAGRPAVGRTKLVRLRIGPGHAIRRSDIIDIAFDLPRAAPGQDNALDRVVFGVAPGERGLISTPIRVDTASGEVRRWDLGANRYAGELLPVRKAAARQADDAWLLTLVTDIAAETTSLWVLDGDDHMAPPVATAALPRLIPFGFHGTWVPHAQKDQT